MRVPSKIKQVLLKNQAWWRFYQEHSDRIRPVVVENILKLLSCGCTVRGYSVYHCSNHSCPHQKKVAFSCKGRFCNTCGHKATEQWIEKQTDILPSTLWQHITLTMPKELSFIFKRNRFLLNELSRLAAKPLLKTAEQKGLIPGLFAALHTFGRSLNWHVHMHLSTTLFGLSADGKRWEKVYLPANKVMRMWRYEVISLLRKSYDLIELPKSLERQCPDAKTWSQWLNTHYQKTWIVHFSKPSPDHKHNVKYLGRYIKRPPLAASRLKHYDGQHVAFQYLDHRSKTYQRFKCSTEEFIKRFVQHIPEKGFRLIRYYGFLSNRLRGQLLPTIYALLGQAKSSAGPLYWQQLMKRSFGLDPLACILCQSPMLLTQRVFGLSSFELNKHHWQLASNWSI